MIDGGCFFSPFTFFLDFVFFGLRVESFVEFFFTVWFLDYTIWKYCFRKFLDCLQIKI